ncbi:MAG: hypothetical protein K0Q74_1597, partial [Gammaproteobacteria bacterium]|nr:hypothetical protein [Gammaproteobacteria bacterium]
AAATSFGVFAILGGLICAVDQSQQDEAAAQNSIVNATFYKMLSAALEEEKEKKAGDLKAFNLQEWINEQNEALAKILSESAGYNEKYKSIQIKLVVERDGNKIINAGWVLSLEKQPPAAAHQPAKMSLKERFKYWLHDEWKVAKLIFGLALVIALAYWAPLILYAGTHGHFDIPLTFLGKALILGLPAILPAAYLAVKSLNWSVNYSSSFQERGLRSSLDDIAETTFWSIRFTWGRYFPTLGAWFEKHSTTRQLVDILRYFLITMPAQGISLPFVALQALYVWSSRPDATSGKLNTFLSVITFPILFPLSLAFGLLRVTIYNPWIAEKLSAVTKQANTWHPLPRFIFFAVRFVLYPVRLSWQLVRLPIEGAHIFLKTWYQSLFDKERYKELVQRFQLESREREGIQDACAMIASLNAHDQQQRKQRKGASIFSRLRNLLNEFAGVELIDSDNEENVHLAQSAALENPLAEKKLKYAAARLAVDAVLRYFLLHIIFLLVGWYLGTAIELSSGVNVVLGLSFFIVSVTGTFFGAYFKGYDLLCKQEKIDRARKVNPLAINITEELKEQNKSVLERYQGLLNNEAKFESLKLSIQRKLARFIEAIHSATDSSSKSKREQEIAQLSEDLESIDLGVTKRATVNNTSLLAFKIFAPTSFLCYPIIMYVGGVSGPWALGIFGVSAAIFTITLLTYLVYRLKSDQDKSNKDKSEIDKSRLGLELLLYFSLSGMMIGGAFLITSSSFSIFSIMAGGLQGITMIGLVVAKRTMTKGEFEEVKATARVIIVKVLSGHGGILVFRVLFSDTGLLLPTIINWTYIDVSVLALILLCAVAAVVWITMKHYRAEWNSEEAALVETATLLTVPEMVMEHLRGLVIENNGQQKLTEAELKNVEKMLLENEVADQKQEDGADARALGAGFSPLDQRRINVMAYLRSLKNDQGESKLNKAELQQAEKLLIDLEALGRREAAVEAKLADLNESFQKVDAISQPARPAHQFAGILGGTKINHGAEQQVITTAVSSSSSSSVEVVQRSLDIMHGEAAVAAIDPDARSLSEWQQAQKRSGTWSPMLMSSKQSQVGGSSTPTMEGAKREEDSSGASSEKSVDISDAVDALLSSKPGSPVPNVRPSPKIRERQNSLCGGEIPNLVL